jgi:uncharacterized protein (TIGR02996 family)
VTTTELVQSAEWRGLLTAISRNPADDLPRLVAADYLEECGELEWAGLIRDWTEERFPIGYRDTIELVHHRTLPQNRRLKYQWEGGFVDVVTCRMSHWLKYAGEICRVHPVTRVRAALKSPHRSVFSNQPPECRWMWIWNENWLPSSVPFAIHKLLKVESPHCKGNDWSGYPTRDTAIDALSAACLAYGRREAGLPPLP